MHISNRYFQYKLKDEVEKKLLQRYKEAETAKPDFIKEKIGKMFNNEEVFVFWYYSGLGCSDGE